MTVEPQAPSFMKTVFSLIKVSSGVYISFVSFGYLQERITRSPYGDKKDPEYFDYPLFLVFVQCLTNSLFTILSKQNKKKKKILKNFLWFLRIDNKKS